MDSKMTAMNNRVDDSLNELKGIPQHIQIFEESINLLGSALKPGGQMILLELAPPFEKPVEIKDNIDHSKIHEPYVIKNYAQDWCAYKNWSSSYNRIWCLRS